MKNYIKNYLTIGAVLTGTAFIVSCDGGSSGDSSTPLVPVIPETPTKISEVLTSDAQAALLTTAGNNLTLTFNDDPTNTPLTISTNTGTIALVAPGDIQAGQTFVLEPPHAATGVSSTPGIVYIASISDGSGAASDSDFSNVVLTETSYTTLGSTSTSKGTFTANLIVDGTSGIPSTLSGGTPPTASSANGAVANVLFSSFFVNIESTAGNQPTVTSLGVTGSVFTVAVGDILFISSNRLYITDSSNAGGTISISGSTPTHDLATPRDAAPGETICLIQDTVAAKLVPQTGNYQITIK